MKSLWKFVSRVSLLVMLFFTGGVVNAKSVQPPEKSPTPPLPSSSAFEPNSRLQTQNTPGSLSTRIGQPGLSFRYVQTFGVTDEPYVANSSHLNFPNGLFIDKDDNLYVVEEKGHRLLKFDASGASKLIIGHAGLSWHQDDYISYPKDVALDNSGNIWVLFNPTVKKFDAMGTPLLTIPDANAWESGNDNYHFNDPRGIAFDGTGRLFVSDTQNHRIQVYDVSGSTPVYVLTIGTTSVPQSDNSGFDQPAQIAFDSSGRLYVMDTANYRVQRCTKNSGTPETWNCTTFLGVTGEPGSDLSHLEWAYGIGIKNDKIYIADGANYRVLKCDTSGNCSLFAGGNGRGWANNQFWWPADVAVDSAGSVFVSDFDNHRVQKFNSAGKWVSTIGVTRVPYVTDAAHLNAPWGIAVAPDGSLYISENKGYRLIKLNANGVQQWTIGVPGVYGSDNAHFGDWWAGLEGDPAIDSSGRVYIGDTANHRVQIFNADGSYYTTLGSYGTGNNQFNCPDDVAIHPINGDIYVLDKCNQRVQVFTPGLIYKATVGVTGMAGSDNLHFNTPWGMTVDRAGNIYVGDGDNYRIQKCMLTGSAPGYDCSTFAGKTGVSGDDFSHLGNTLSIKVDASGRVYVADEWNNRVQVFDSTGAYLTTIGGSWGSKTGELRGPAGVAVDAQGNVYVADRDNHRIQKFAPGVPGWRQVNINGFGERTNLISTLGTFGSYLYAGTYNFGGNVAQLWRSGDGLNWSPIITNGFGKPSNVGIDHLTEFNGRLYAGTWNQIDTSTPPNTMGGEIWRSSDGLNWDAVVTQGFGDPTNGEVFRFAVFNDTLYASTWSYTDEHGFEIWRSSTGNSEDWTRVISNGFGDANNVAAPSFEVFNNFLYAGTYNMNTGGEVWRSNTGDSGSWSQVNTDGFGDAGNVIITALAAFKGHLYANTLHPQGTTGAQIWRCQTCDGSDWQKVVDNGFGNADTRGMSALEIFNEHLYFVVGNSVSGMEIWRTADGMNWEQVGFAGFGDSNNYATYWDNSTTVFNNSLFIGTFNSANGGEVWRMLRTVYLPAVIK